MLELQSLAVLSSEAVSTAAPSAEKTADVTQPECPESVSRHSPVLELQSLAVLSCEAVSTAAPSAEKTADVT